jgi:hypothetical protein
VRRAAFEIQKPRYNPTFARRTFSFPPRAFDAGAVRHGTLAKLPPFRAVIATYGRAATLSNVDEGWWLNEHTWRIKTLADHQRGNRGTDPNDSRAGYFTGAGSFSVMAYGIERVCDAHDHTFFRNVDAERDAGPVDGLLEYLENIDYSPARCPVAAPYRPSPLRERRALDRLRDRPRVESARQRARCPWRYARSDTARAPGEKRVCDAEQRDQGTNPGGSRARVHAWRLVLVHLPQKEAVHVRREREVRRHPDSSLPR